MERETLTWSPDVNLLGYWILVTALGGAVVYPAILLLGAAALDSVFRSILPAFLVFAGPMAAALGGALVGFGQWFVLRSKLPASHSWTLVTILSWCAGVVMTVAVFAWLLPDGLGYFTLLSPFAFGGGAAGLIQERAMRRWFSGGWWWILASASGWVLGWVMGLGLAGLYGRNLAIPPGMGLLAMGAIHGGVIGLQSGMALILLFSHKPVSNK